MLDGFALGVPVGVVRCGAHAEGVSVVGMARVDVKVAPEDMSEWIVGADGLL